MKQSPFYIVLKKTLLFEWPPSVCNAQVTAEVAMPPRPAGFLARAASCQGDDLLYCNRQCRLMFIHQLLQQGFSLTCTVSCGPDESGNCVGARYNPQAPVSCQVGLLLIEFVPQVDERSLASRTSKNQEADNLDCKRQLHCHNFNSSTSAACETRMR